MNINWKKIMMLFVCLAMFGCGSGGGGDDSGSGGGGGTNYLSSLVGIWRTMDGSVGSYVATVEITSSGTFYFKVQKPNGEFVRDYIATMSNITSSSWDYRITGYSGAGSDPTGQRGTDNYVFYGNTLDLNEGELVLEKQGILTSDFYFEVISPGGGVTLEPGLTYQIIWRSSAFGTSSTMAKIDIYKDGIFYETIVSSTWNYVGIDSSYSWTVPSYYPEGSTYSIWITNVDYPLFWDRGENFYIGDSAEDLPTVSDPLPADGAIIDKGSLLGYGLFVSTSSGISSCRFYYDDDNTFLDYSVAGTIIEHAAGDYCYITIEFYPGRFTDDGTNYWYAEVTNSAGTTRYPSSGNLSFEISSASSSGFPVISNPSPVDNSTVTEGSSGQLLRVSVSDADSCIFYYDNDSAISFSQVGTIIGGSCGYTIPYVSGRMDKNGTNYWYVMATNSVGTTRYPTSGNLEFEVVP